MRNLEIWFWRKELSLKTKIRIVTLFSPESSSNRTNPSLQASGQKVKTITKMSPDKIRSKRTNVQCDDRRPDHTTIYDQESIKYRPPPLSLLFGLDQKYNGQLIVQTIVKPMISVLPGHSKSIIENSKLNPKSKQQNV